MGTGSPTTRVLVGVLAALAFSAGLQAQNCGGVLANTCGLVRPVSVAGGGSALPATFSTCTPADAHVQGLTLFDVPAGLSVKVELSAMTADFDLYVHLPPGICESDLQPGAYRLADSGGLAGLADECEELTPAELSAYGCGWFGVVAYCKDPGGGSCELRVDCVAAGACGGGGGGSCPTLCGDCSLDGAGPNILDALTAAQLAAMVMPPLPGQSACCDVNSSGAIDVLDALRIAQTAAGIPVTLVCP